MYQSESKIKTEKAEVEQNEKMSKTVPPLRSMLFWDALSTEKCSVKFFLYVDTD